MGRLDELKTKLKEVKPTLGTTIGNVAWSGLAQKAASFPFDFTIVYCMAASFVSSITIVPLCYVFFKRTAETESQKRHKRLKKTERKSKRLGKVHADSA